MIFVRMAPFYGLSISQNDNFSNFGQRIIMEYVFLLIGLIVGAVTTYILINNKLIKLKQNNLEEITSLKQEHTRVLNQKESENLVLKSKLEGTEKELSHHQIQLHEETRLKTDLISEKTALEERLKAMGEKLETQKQEITGLHQKLSVEFENLSNRIFKTHSTDFRETSSRNLNDLLNPLKEKLQSFEKKVEETHDLETRHRESLKTEVSKLFELNQRISKEAQNLTHALKGDVKTMGNWGEVVLDRILEQCGLEEGTMYVKQMSLKNDEGSRLQPDVVILMPDNKNIIIDSKVSLLAYERAVNADNDEDRARAIREHIVSVQNHIKLLSSKNYQLLEGLDTPDFVLLFIPVEASFSLAIREDIQLFDLAWKNRIVIVGPSTLLATLKTIQSIWKTEKQTRNANEIAKVGNLLFDKFVGFIEDLEKIGKSMNITQNAYHDAIGKLSTGKGNLVRQANRLRELGVKSSKTIPEKFLDTGDVPLIEEKE